MSIWAAQAPIGAIFRYWMTPSQDRVHVHRIEVEHGLYLAAASQLQVKAVLTEGLRQQSESLRELSAAIDELGDQIASGFAEVSEGLASLESTTESGLAAVDTSVRQGFYQLHLDVRGLGATLDDVLLLMYDRAAYERELQVRRTAAKERDAKHAASNRYSGAMALTQRAFNEVILAKADAMLDEAMVLFLDASSHGDFAMDAHFQLGYLAQQHRRDLTSAYEHYEKALGPSYSHHYVRTARHLAHLDFVSGRHDMALQRMKDLIAQDDKIKSFAADLKAVTAASWESNSNIHALENALKKNRHLLSQSPRLAQVQRELDDRRRFTATETFLFSHPLIARELAECRPDARVYFDAARYAAKTGHSAQAARWIKHCHDSQPTLNARRAFLLTAMADQDLRDA